MRHCFTDCKVKGKRLCLQEVNYQSQIALLKDTPNQRVSDLQDELYRVNSYLLKIIVFE